jgi:hypothetical protein
MFDFTKNITLEPVWQKRYQWGRFMIFLLFFLSLIYLAYLILFPITRLLYSFADSRQQSTLITNFKTADQSVFENGVLKENNSLSFGAFDGESHSKIDLFFTLDSGTINPKENSLTLKKGYQAFAYPLDQNLASFPDGSLLKGREGKNEIYYIVSEKKLRPFKNIALLKEMGYAPEAFVESTPEELSLTPPGDPIANGKDYPNDALFFINKNYYQLKNKTLQKFVSVQAFTSRFNLNQAIAKETEFLSSYPLSTEPLGFADGSLLAFGEAVFIVNNGKIMPFPNPFTFNSFGLSWDDITQASEDEIGLYQRDKFFNMQQPHPNGTVFFETETKKYFLISEGTKREIQGANILKSLLKKSPISASTENLSFEEKCAFRKVSLFRNKYRCSIVNEKMKSLPGNGYQISFAPKNSTDLKEIEIVFSEHVNSRNLSLSLSRMLNLLFSHYGYVPKQ